MAATIFPRHGSRSMRKAVSSRSSSISSPIWARYLSCYAPYIPWLGAGMATGAYDIPVAVCTLRAAYTNTVPVDAYRGAGRPEASYLIERVVDAAAREIGVTPYELRRKNLIKTKALPYKTPTGKVYDSATSRAPWYVHKSSSTGVDLRQTCRAGQAYRQTTRHWASNLR